ncbi:MAG: FkbM family methyltransferase [Acidobacteriota bacterium]|nr:FkbM family methyltransferase [Acidobacteriota bacterium]
MTPDYFCVHHVGGRADGTRAFPEVPGFDDQIFHVIYEADARCIEAIERQWTTPLKSILPYCLADAKRESSPFHLNGCPFTSSLFPFNEAFSHYYEAKAINGSDYVFGESFRPLRVCSLATHAIDQLFAEQKAPQVDFLSIDAQGAELLILEGASRMLAETTVAVSTEVSFVNLYQGAPVFGDVDAYLRDKGFLLARLAPMEFGYKRIPRPFRGAGLPLQGETLYFVKPENITNASPAVRQTRLEKLAFCALAFGYTELAFEAVERSLGINALAPGGRQAFLRKFHAEVAHGPALPRLWHELPPAAEPARGPFAVRALKRLAADPRKFVEDLRRLRRRHFVRTAMALKRPRMAFNAFERFLSDSGFHFAACEVCIRRLG